MKLIDGDAQVEITRGQCFDLAASAFSTNQLDLDAYESLAAQIAAAKSLPELVEIRSRLPEIEQPQSVLPQPIRATSSNIKKVGRWLESPRIELTAQSSKIILDFTAYGSEHDLRIDLALDCRSADVRIVVPRDIDVVDRIESNRASVYRDRHRPASANSAILITGSLSGSRVRVKRKKNK